MATKPWKAMGLVKWLWHDKPDLACCFVFVTLGYVALGIKYKIYDPDIDHMHRHEYKVIREESADPVCKEKGAYN